MEMNPFKATGERI